jgi:hypothetical protein
MTDDPAPRSDVPEPAGDAARPGASKSTGPRTLPAAEADEQDRAAQPGDDDVDVVVDKTDMSAVGDDGQVFGG